MGHNQRRHCGPIHAEARKKRYAAMPGIVTRNKKRKLLKHVMHHQNDLQALSALN